TVPVMGASAELRSVCAAHERGMRSDQEFAWTDGRRRNGFHAHVVHRAIHSGQHGGRDSLLPPPENRLPCGCHVLDFVLAYRMHLSRFCLQRLWLAIVLIQPSAEGL